MFAIVEELSNLCMSGVENPCLGPFLTRFVASQPSNPMTTTFTLHASSFILNWLLDQTIINPIKPLNLMNGGRWEPYLRKLVQSSNELSRLFEVSEDKMDFRPDISS